MLHPLHCQIELQTSFMRYPSTRKGKACRKLLGNVCDAGKKGCSGATGVDEFSASFGLIGDVFYGVLAELVEQKLLSSSAMPAIDEGASLGELVKMRARRWIMHVV
jgi:hypothetical protein